MKIVLPTWAKLLIGVFVASAIGCVISIIMAATTFANWQHKVRDPAEAQKIASSTWGMQQLPPKFVWTAGMTMPPQLTAVTAAYDNGTTDLILQQFENKHGLTDPNLPEILQQDPFQAGITLEKPVAGETIVGGHKMSYIVGDLGHSGKVKQMRGAFLTNNNKMLNRFTATTAGPVYDMEATKQFLSCIK